VISFDEIAKKADYKISLNKGGYHGRTIESDF
jgi:hypothetical protein